MNSKPESVVTGRNSDAQNNPYLPAQTLISELLWQGIERLVIGHTPTGDYPLILRTKDDLFEVISADNSYAKSQAFASLLHFKGVGLKQTLAQGTVALENEILEIFSNLTLGISTPIGKKIGNGLLLGHLANNPQKLMSFHYGENFRIFTGLHMESEIDWAKLLEPSAPCEDSLR